MNGAERTVKAMLEERGYRVLRNGWPDFLCVRKYIKNNGKFWDGAALRG
jgi:hypothetical protein